MPWHKWEDIRRSKPPSESERRALLHEADCLATSVDALRRELGLTEGDMDAAFDRTEDVVQLSERTDQVFSTLRRLVQALGGDIEVVAVVGGKRVKLMV